MRAFPGLLAMLATAGTVRAERELPLTWQIDHSPVIVLARFETGKGYKIIEYWKGTILPGQWQESMTEGYIMPLRWWGVPDEHETVFFLHDSIENGNITFNRMVPIQNCKLVWSMGWGDDEVYSVTDFRIVVRRRVTIWLAVNSSAAAHRGVAESQRNSN